MDMLAVALGKFGMELLHAECWLQLDILFMEMDRLHNCLWEAKFRSQHTIVFQFFCVSLCTALKL